MSEYLKNLQESTQVLHSFRNDKKVVVEQDEKCEECGKEECECKKEEKEEEE